MRLNVKTGSKIRFILIPVLLLFPVSLIGSSPLYCDESNSSIRVSVRDDITIAYESSQAMTAAEERHRKHYAPRLRAMITKVERAVNKHALTTVPIDDSLPRYIYSNDFFFRETDPVQQRFNQSGIVEFSFLEEEYLGYFVEIAVKSLPTQTAIDLLYKELFLELTCAEFPITPHAPEPSHKWYEFWK